MQPKPTHLGPQYGAQFGDPSVVAAYSTRPPYPAALFPLLAGLIGDTPRTVLDAGCGPGSLARPLAPLVDRVDAVDIAPAMIAAGRVLPGGDHPHVRWIVGSLETVPLDLPYALVTAGSSLHWMDWAVVLPRMARLLTPHGVLAITGDAVAPTPWHAALQPVIDYYSTNRDYQPYDLVQELVGRGLFVVHGQTEVASPPFTQPVSDYIESYHARNGFSRDRMSAEAAAAFDREARAVLDRYCPDGQVTLHLRGAVVWGRPGVGRAP